MEAFNALSQVADGYVGEAMSDMAGKLYYNAFETLISFLSNPIYNSEDLLHDVSNSFYYEIVGDHLPEQRRSEIIADIHKRKLDVGRTEVQRRILTKLEQKVRELKAD